MTSDTASVVMTPGDDLGGDNPVDGFSGDEPVDGLGEDDPDVVLEGVHTQDVVVKSTRCSPDRGTQTEVVV